MLKKDLFLFLLESRESSAILDIRNRFFFVTNSSFLVTRLGIAKIAAASIIDTLQENDYFNVITVNDTETYVIPNVKYMLQATKENKEAMQAAIQKIGKPSDAVDVDYAIQAAFDVLNSGTYSDMYGMST